MSFNRIVSLLICVQLAWTEDGSCVGFLRQGDLFVKCDSRLIRITKAGLLTHFQIDPIMGRVAFQIEPTYRGSNSRRLTGRWLTSMINRPQLELGESGRWYLRCGHMFKDNFLEANEHKAGTGVFDHDSLDLTQVQDYTSNSILCAADQSVLRFFVDIERITVQVGQVSSNTQVRFGPAMELIGSTFDIRSLWIRSSKVGNMLLIGDQSHLCVWNISKVRSPEHCISTEKVQVYQADVDGVGNVVLEQATSENCNYKSRANFRPTVSIGIEAEDACIAIRQILRKDWNSGSSEFKTIVPYGRDPFFIKEHDVKELVSWGQWLSSLLYVQ